MNRSYYQIKGFLKHSEQHVYAEGCVKNSRNSFLVDYPIQESSFDDLVEKAMGFLGMDDKKSVLLNACDELGRIDFQVYEGENGCAANEHDYNLWEEGKRKLWLCNYSALVSYVKETEGPNLIAATNNAEQYTTE